MESIEINRSLNGKMSSQSLPLEVTHPLKIAEPISNLMKQKKEADRKLAIALGSASFVTFIGITYLNYKTSVLNKEQTILVNENLKKLDNIS